ncbi:MAG TPA: peptidylprolyl isomerase [Acidobacteriaceae bacterium]
MTRRGAQHGSMRRLSCHRLVLPGLLLLGVTLIVPVYAQSTQSPTPTPMPIAPTSAAPPVPESIASAPPSAAKSHASPTTIVEPALPGMPAVQGTQIDRIVAIVNGALILDSDVDQERRFAALLPYGETSGSYDRDKAVARLINRELILQQARLQPGNQISLQAAAKDLDALRKSLPSCKEFHCETQAGWDRFLATQGFTQQSLTKLWRDRMDVLQFIELRFRMGIKISQEEIDKYYTETMLPQYEAKHVTPPPVQSIASRIQEVLLQQQVSSLLGDWLDSLRAQGSVVVLQPGQGAP